MPLLRPGTQVSIRSAGLRRLTFPPPQDGALLVAIHPSALKSPRSPHSQLVGFVYGELAWAGALGEGLLDVLSEDGGDPRQLLAEAVATGARLWDVVWPGELVRDGGPLSTIYQGERPWVVVGETALGDLLAAPLNEAANPKWYTPLLAREEILMAGSAKDAQLELAHLWSFPGSMAALGTVAPGARPRLLAALRGYF
jgi:hypothetical protein